MGNAGTSKRGRLVEWVEKTSFDCLNKLFEITAAERHYQTLLTAGNLLAVVREPQPYVTNILPRRLPKRVVPGEHFVLKYLPFYERAREADAKERQERLDQREEKRQEGTLRKAPGEKGCDPSPAARPPATKEKKKTKKTKKTLAQVLRIAALTLEASPSSCRSGPSQPDHTILESDEVKEPKATSSSLQLVIFYPGPSSPQPEPESAGLQVVDEPEEMRNTSNLRAGLLRRHGKRLHVPIYLGSPPAKKVCPDRGGEDPTPEVLASVATYANEDGPSASSAAPPNAAGSSATTTVKVDAPGPSSPAVVETPMLEGVPDASNGEEAPDEKGSHAVAVPPSWEDLMEMLKGVPCFTDAEVRLPFGTPEPAVSCT